MTMKVGRPPIKDGSKKDIILPVRITHKERDKFKRICDRYKTTMSHIVRAFIITTLEKEGRK